MAELKSVWRRFGGNHDQWNLADDPAGGGSGQRLRPEVEQAFLEDEVAYHREQMQLSAKLLAIAGARSVQSQATA